MKKIVAAFAALLAAASLFALDITAGGRVGFDLNIFDFKSGDFDDFVDNLKPMPGFEIQLYGNIGIPVVEGLGVQPELGFHYRNAGFVPKAGDDWAFHYMTLDIPVLVTYKYDINDMFFVQPGIGPKFSFVLGNFIVDEPSGIGDLEDLKSPFNFGLVVGLGFGINVGPGSVIVDVRYDRDFTKIVNDAGSEFDVGSTQSIDISVGYQMLLPF